MEFYIYHRPLRTIKFKELVGELIHVSWLKKDFSPDGEVWKVLKLNRPVEIHDRLARMLAAGGMTPDNIYPLDGNRSVKDLVKYMNQWEKK